MSAEPDKTRAAIAEAASEWFVRSRDETLSTAEHAEFANWLKESPVHVEEYLAIARLWGAVPNVPGIEGLESIPGSSSNVVHMPEDSGPAETGVSQDADEEHQTTPRDSFAIAASLFAAAIAIALLMWTQFDAPDRHATGLGEQRSLVLADGTLVELNTESKISVSYTETARRVILESGEAFFDVKEGDERPFEVATGGASIRVLGTRFNVYHRISDTTVTVVEGNVSVEAVAALETIDNSGATGSASDRPVTTQIELGAGEQAVIDYSELSIRTNAIPSTERYTAWTERRLIFEQTRLARVLEEFARYNDLEFRLTSDRIASLELTGTFDSHDFQSFVEYLEFHSDVSVEQDGKLLIIGSVQ